MIEEEENRVEMAPSNNPKIKTELRERTSRSLSTWTPSKAFQKSMFTGRFCCCFSLQAGICIYTAMGFAMMLCVIIGNLGGEIHPLDAGHELAQFSILYIYALPMTVGFCLAYFGSVKPSLKCLKIGNWIVVGFSVFWIIIASLSFVDDENITEEELSRVMGVSPNRRIPKNFSSLAANIAAFFGEDFSWFLRVDVTVPRALSQPYKFQRLDKIAANTKRILRTAHYHEHGVARRAVCIDKRCAETHWLVKTYFRSYGNDCNLGEDELLGEDLADDQIVSEDTDDDDEEGGGERESHYELRNKTLATSEEGTTEEEPHETDAEYGGARNISQSGSRKAKQNETDNYYEYDIDRISLGSKLKSATKEPQDLHTEASYKKSGLAGLDIVLFETRIIGCSTNPNFYRALSIIAMLFWIIFMVNGIIGTFLLIKDVNRMVRTGEINQALTHLSFDQERQERQSRN